MAFDDTRLPVDIEQGATGGPSFLTSVIGMSSGQEQRNVDWSEARGTWEIGYGIQSKSDFQAALAFFYARRGRGRGFRFKDWSDFELTAEIVGYGDASNRDFQIIKTYSASSNPYIRRITRPVASTIVVTVDDVESAVWTLQTGGVVRFNAGSAPGLAAVVKVTCEFDVPVRFDTDAFSITMAHFLAGEIPSLSIVELRE